MKIERGDILMVNLGQVPGTSLQSGIRPVVVVSNNKANTYSPVVTVVPFTSRVYKKRYLPTHVFINRYEMVGLKRHGLVLARRPGRMVPQRDNKGRRRLAPRQLHQILLHPRQFL